MALAAIFFCLRASIIVFTFSGVSSTGMVCFLAFSMLLSAEGESL